MASTGAGRPIHFLLIEDDEDHAYFVTRALDDNRVANKITHMIDGESGLAYLRREPPYESSERPDVVLLDLRLPRMSGHEVLEIIKKEPGLCAIPVVVLTTSKAEADRERAYRLHANSYLLKPVDFERFHQMVRDLSLYWSVWNEPPGMMVV